MIVIDFFFPFFFQSFLIVLPLSLLSILSLNLYVMISHSQLLPFPPSPASHTHIAKFIESHLHEHAILIPSMWAATVCLQGTSWWPISPLATLAWLKAFVASNPLISLPPSFLPSDCLLSDQLQTKALEITLRTLGIYRKTLPVVSGNKIKNWLADWPASWGQMATGREWCHDTAKLDTLR